MNATNIKQGYLLVLLAGFFWGTGGVFVKQLGAIGVASNLIAFTSLLIGSLLILLFILSTKGLAGLRISWRGLTHAAVLGILTKGLFRVVYNYAILRVGVSTAAVLLYMAPILTAIGAAIFFNERITKNKAVAIGINIIGCILMVTGGRFADFVFDGFGIMLGLLTAAMYAFQTIYGRISTTDTDPMALAFYMLFISSLFLIPLVDFGPMAVYRTMPTFWINIMGYGLFATAIANILFLRGVSYPIEASRIPVLTSVEIVVMVFSGVWFYQELFTPWTIVGLICLIIGIILMNRPQVSEPSAG